MKSQWKVVWCTLWKEGVLVEPLAYHVLPLPGRRHPLQLLLLFVA